MEQWR